MKKKKIQRTILFRKTMIVLCILSGIEILIMTLLGLYDSMYIMPRQTHSGSFSISAEDIQTTTDQNQKDVTDLASLEILPSDYDTLTKNFGAFTQHDLTTYLRYSEVLKAKDITNLTNGYTYLEENNLNILIPQTYINQYVLAEVQDISQSMITESNDTEVTPYLEIHQESTLHTDLSTCISQNLDTFLKGTTCTDMLAKINDESLSPTLNFLTTSLKFSPNKSENEYDTYIENHMYLYQMEKGNTQIVSSENSHSYSNDIYIDLDQRQIHKIQLISNYLQAVNSKLGYFSEATKTKLNDLDTLVGLLAAYKYGDTIPTVIKDLINNQLINLTQTDNGYAQANTQISFLIKSVNLNNEVKTFVAPMYIFESKDETPVPVLTFEVNDNNFNEDYDITPATQAKGTVRVPIFMYHQIVTPPKGQSSFRSGLYVDPLDFEREMAYLVKKNYKTASSAEYYKILKSGKNPKQKTVMITFDDGVSNQYTNAYPILKKYGLTGVFFIVSQRSGITGTQMKEMTANGMEIGSHSAQHQDLMKISDPKVLTSEIVSSKYGLQSASGKAVNAFAYPGCGWNSQTLTYVSSAGYLLGMSCGSTIDNYPGNNLVLSRVHAYGDMKSFKNLLSGIR